VSLPFLFTPPLKEGRGKSCPSEAEKKRESDLFNHSPLLITTNYNLLSTIYSFNYFINSSFFVSVNPPASNLIK